MLEAGFDNEKYLALQSEHIEKRIKQFGGKLYLEFGGKLFDDYHAARVLPGFLPDSKLKMLLQLRDRAEIVIVINSVDIEKSKVRLDIGITYDMDVLRLIDAFRNYGLYVGSVVLSMYNNQPAVQAFERRLTEQGIRVYRHYEIEGYPRELDMVISEQGYGKNDYIETTRELIVVTAPGPGSGKMATCLSQLYHDHKRGICAGYAKFETFPIWNIPLNHPVNSAYEAATADLNDINMIDPYHLEAYGQPAVNYNRDIESFPVLNAMFDMILGSSPYKSPTDMGVNMAGFCIVDDDVCVRASRQEIIRRYYSAVCRRVRGETGDDELMKIELIMKKANIKLGERRVVEPAINKARLTGESAAAIELPNGKILTGRTGKLLGCCAALLLNSLKELAGIADDIMLISPVVIEPIQRLKVDHLGNENPRLHTDEVLLALSICAATNPTAQLAMDQLKNLKGSEVHSSVILSSVDQKTFKRLGVNVTCEPVYQSKNLYHG